MENKREFKVGDKVCHEMFGKGVVKSTNHISRFVSFKELPLLVLFENGQNSTFTLDGRNDENTIIYSLFHIENELETQPVYFEVGDTVYHPINNKGTVVNIDFNAVNEYQLDVSFEDNTRQLFTVDGKHNIVYR
jgi:hypothetical protein